MVLQLNASSQAPLFLPPSHVTDGASRCRNTARCAQVALHQLQKLPEVIKQHAAFLMHTPHSIVASEHAVQRIAERGYSYEEVVSVIECCEPVEWMDFSVSVERVQRTYGSLARHVFKPLRHGILIKGETANGRALIVVCRYGDQPQPGTNWEMHISTVYDPSDHAHRWDEGYSHRICFCSDEQQKERARGIEDRLLAAARERDVVYSSESFPPPQHARRGLSAGKSREK